MTTVSASDSYLGDATTTAALLWNQLTRETRRLCAGERKHQDGSPGGLSGRRESRYGLPAIAADASAHEELATAIGQIWPHRRVVGEEAEARAWDHALDSPPGTEIVSLDALDGSVLFDTVTYGHGATAGLYRAGHGDAVELLYTVTVNSTGLALVYLAGEDAVFVGSACAEGTFRRVTATDLWPVENIRHDVVACVAASPRHRELVAPLLATDVDWQLPGQEMTPHAGLTVVTTGGAPAAIGLVVARLAALVLPNRQTLHDAAPMLALAALDIPTFDERGNPVSYPALKARFHELARPDAGHAAYHPVPRLVFSRRPELGRLLARRVFGRAEEGRRGARSHGPACRCDFPQTRPPVHETAGGRQLGSSLR